MGKKKSKLVSFELAGVSKSGKTVEWRVNNTDDILGYIRWYAPWRKYSFLPCRETVFEQDCLRSIADFCEAETKKQRAKK